MISKLRSPGLCAGGGGGQQDVDTGYDKIFFYPASSLANHLGQLGVLEKLGLI